MKQGTGMFFLRILFWCARLFCKLILTSTLLGGIALVVYTAFWLPDVSFLAEENPETTAFIEQARENYRRNGSAVRIRQDFVPLNRISKYLIQAVRIAEDDRFYQHNGFDFTEIRNAIQENLRTGRFARGGSTITQQLAKNLFLSPDKTLTRKFNEMLLTWKLEHHLTKDRILELYLNYAYWGFGCFGAEAASRFFFSKPASKLTSREAANLAARLPQPDYLGSHSGENQRRAREKIILARMNKENKTHRIPPHPQHRNTISNRNTLPKTHNHSDSLAKAFSDFNSQISKWKVVARDRITDWIQDKKTIRLPGMPVKELDDGAPEPRPETVPSQERPSDGRRRININVSSLPPRGQSSGDIEKTPRNPQSTSTKKQPRLSLLEKLNQLEKAWSD